MSQSKPNSIGLVGAGVPVRTLGVKDKQAIGR